MDTWHKRLTAARKAKALKPSELARRVGVSAPTITEWENGQIKTITADNMLSVCLELGITPLWLMRGQGPRSAADGHQGPEPLDPLAREILANLPGLTPEQQQAIAAEIATRKKLNDDLMAQLLARQHAG
jgi:transcriptional regulator with XRE-family HTH domain